MVNSMAYYEKIVQEPESSMPEEKKFLFEEDEQHFTHSLKENSILNGSDVKKLNLILNSGQTELSVVQLILNLGMASETDLLNYLSTSLRLRILVQEDFPGELFAEHIFNKKFLREQNVLVICETDQFIELCINKHKTHLV